MNKDLRAGLCAACLLFASAHAEAKSAWRFGAALYGWGVEVDGLVVVRDDDSGYYWALDPDTFFDDTPLLFGGFVEANNGRMGGFLDLTYLSLNDTGPIAFDTRFATEPIVGDGELEQSGWAATFAGSVSLTDYWRYPTQFFLGGRYTDIDTDATWVIDDSVELPPFLDYTGSASASYSSWDGIVGFKGRAYLSKKKSTPWFVSYYGDIGAGESDLTWQAALGAGYRFRGGEASLLWRHLQYDVPDDELREDFYFTGPMLSVGFRFGGTTTRRR